MVLDTKARANVSNINAIYLQTLNINQYLTPSITNIKHNDRHIAVNLITN